MKGKRMISGMLAVMTFLMTASPASLPFAVLAADGESVEQESLYTLGTSLSDEVIINNETFPDETFRSYVLNNIDTDRSGGLSKEETGAVNQINVAGEWGSNGNITDLTGIELFTNLQILYCSNNQLTYLDLSQNKALKTLECHNNQLTGLNISNNTALERLIIEHNPNLGSIDVSRNTALKYIDVLACGLTSLNVTNNTKLQSLYCHYNSIKELNTSNNPYLQTLCCWGNKLTSLDLKNNTKLQSLYCYNNSISELDLTYNTELTYLNADKDTVITGYDRKEIALSISGINGQNGYVSCRDGILTDGSSVTENTELYININVDDYVNHELYINDKKVLLDNFLSGDGYYFYYFCQAEGSSMSIELKEEMWSAERMADYNCVEADDDVKLYCYNSYLESTAYGQQKCTGSYVKKGTQVSIFVEKSDMPENGIIEINDIVVDYELNDKGQYQIIAYDVPKDSNVLKVSIKGRTDYTVLNADEGIRVYWYNKYTGYIVNYPNTIANGSYIPKDAQVCIRISSKLYPNMPKLYINGHFQASSMNMDKDWQIWGLYVPDDDVFRITIDGMASDKPVAEINENTFPDDAFRAEVKSKADLNGDNKLTENEILQTEYLTICGTDDEPGSIKSLKGIEYFTELKFLDCCNNEIEDIDISVFPKLYFLSCGNNNLKSLDVSKNPYLTQLYCSGNKLTEIDVSANKSLERFACADNLLTSLDVSSNTALTWLYCSVNKLTELDLSHNPKLVTLGVNENCLTSLDLTENQLITEYDDKGNKAQVSLTNGSFPLAALKGFDPSRASNWQGAEYDESKNALKNFTSDTVTYSYDCGNGHSMEFTLVCTAVTVSDIIVTDSSVTVRYTDNSSATYAFDKVPTELVDEMDTQLAADFVNAFTGSSVGDIILTDAELKAIEKVLEKDYIQ